jgi:N-acyl-D-aspartate/D-glutamate deacylase
VSRARQLDEPLFTLTAANRTQLSFVILWGPAGIRAVIGSQSQAVWSSAMTLRPERDTVAHDVVIKNGILIDGTGTPARPGDVAIDGDRVTAIGHIDESAANLVIDAEGKIVTPGFVDLHSHLDAQVGWDPIMSLSCYHGVTSVVMGNCGMTFAPVRTGSFADINVLDLDASALGVPEIVNDFPGGHPRFAQSAIGIDHTFVNGEHFMDNGEHTGALAGRLLRSA